MGTYVALLRGINVGRAKRIAMADLRAVVESLGYGDVRTLLNSGNLVFTAKGAAKNAATRIEKGITTSLGVSSRVTLISASELETIVAQNPLEEVATDPTRLLVAVFADAADLTQVEPLLDRDWGNEALAIGPRAAYLWCPDGVIKSKLWATVGRTLGDRVTSRNWNTIVKLRELAR